MKICLYAPVAVQDENKPRDRSAWSKFKAFVKRGRDRAKWRLTSDRAFDFDAWNFLEGTNRGDMAIRLSIQDLLSRIYTSDVEYLEYSWGTLSSQAVEHINKSCDLFVIAGGGYLFTGQNGDLGNRRVPMDLDFLKMLTCPTVAYGIGVNQVLNEGVVPPTQFNKRAADTIRAWLNEIDLVAVRDDATRCLLLQVTDKPIFLVGDPALFLDAPLAPEIQCGHVGINFAVHGPRSASLFAKHFQKYHSALQELQRQGFILKYFQHSETDSLAFRMLTAENVNLEIIDRPPRSLVTAYSEMDFVFCQMLHPAILAARGNVPSINVAYDRKNFAFYKLLGMEKFCVHHEAFSATWLSERITEIIGNRADISSSIAQRKSALHKEHLAFLEAVKGLGCRPS